MSTRLLRRCAALLIPALLVPALAACGTKAGYGDATVAGFGAAQVAGSYGKTPTITWTGEQAYPSSPQVKTLVQGTGPTVGSTEVDLHIYIADSLTDQSKAETACRSTPSSSASASPSASASASSSALPTPKPLPSCAAVTYPLKGSWLYNTTANGTSYDSMQPQTGTIWATLLSNVKIGSRIEALVGSDQVFPATSSSAPGAPSLGIGSDDPLVLVIDVVRKTPVSPTPSDAKAHTVKPSALPGVITNAKGQPTGFDWKGFKKPSLTTPVQRAILKQGHGAVIKSTDTVTVHYFGETYGAKKYFDENYYDKTDPSKSTGTMTQPLSGLVQGWSIGLTGVRVGSRVLLQIPPDFGYGAQGTTGIKGNATLWFVIDVTGAKAGSSS